MLDDRDNGIPGETPGATLMRALGNMQRHEADGGRVEAVVVLGVVRTGDGGQVIVRDETPGLPFYAAAGLLQTVADELRRLPPRA